jgi:predicted TIM-barrel fold metal-dependent hydrolase
MTVLTCRDKNAGSCRNSATSSRTCTVVIDHMADCPIDRPDLLEKLIELKRYPKVFVKISHTWSLSKQGFPVPRCLAPGQAALR